MSKTIFLSLYLAAIHVLAGLYVWGCIREKNKAAAAAALPSSPAPDSARAFDNADTVRLRSSAGADSPALVSVSPGPGLVIPVKGVRRTDLMDTYTQSREGGARVHNAIDIPAAEGTPVLAAADGPIAKFFDSKAGGTTIYQWSADSGYVYYYAHLQYRAGGIAEGQYIRRGTVIGYVGNTGNAGPQNYHLHFSVSIPTVPGRHWEGEYINPYPLLKEGIETAH